MSLIFSGDYYDNKEIMDWYDKPIGAPFHNEDYSNAIILSDYGKEQMDQMKLLDGLTKKQQAAVYRLIDRFRKQNRQKN